MPVNNKKEATERIREENRRIQKNKREIHI